MEVEYHVEARSLNENARIEGPGDPHRWRELLPIVPGVAELVAEGFTPIESLTGKVELVKAWPEEHLRVVKETRYELTGLEPFDQRWDLRLFLVRSPWPSIDTEQVVMLIGRWLRRNESAYLIEVEEVSPSGQVQTRRAADEKAEFKVVRQFFRQSESWIRAYSHGHVNRLSR